MVLAAVIGALAGVVEVPFLSGTPASSELQVTVRELEGKVAQLEQENRQLSESLAEGPSGPSNPSSASPSPSSPAADDPRRQTEADAPVTLADDSCLDLDSQAPNWGANNVYDGDLCFNGYQLDGENLTVFDEEPDRAGCEARTDVTESRQTDALLDKFVCLDSSTGYTTRLHVVSLDPGDSGPTISFEITVWQ